jgi:SAM-dependent methyltransferase
MPEERDTWQDLKYLLGVQYANSARLTARANIHAKYGRGDWFAWLAAQPDWPHAGSVLEVGCGPGWFWADATPFVNPSVRLQLTDLAAGMVAEAIERVRGIGHWDWVTGQVADASALPFPDASFDAVLASHMLYHLPNPRNGVTEIARVLRPGGTAIVATNGMANMRELFDLRRRVFGSDAGGQVSRAFALENGQAMLEAAFSEVELRRYPDVLICTDPADLFGYLTSSPPGDNASETETAALRIVVGEAFDAGGGTFTVTKDMGAFLCRLG